MGEPGREEYKIQSFDAETQKLLKQALKGEHGELSRAWPGSGAAEEVPGGQDWRTAP